MDLLFKPTSDAERNALLHSAVFDLFGFDGPAKPDKAIVKLINAFQSAVEAPEPSLRDCLVIVQTLFVAAAFKVGPTISQFVPDCEFQKADLGSKLLAFIHEYRCDLGECFELLEEHIKEKLNP